MNGWQRRCPAALRFVPAAFLACGLVSTARHASAQSPSDTTSLETARAGSNGPTLLLIPCMSCRWRSFDTFMERNRERYRMIAVTLPGFGGTSVPELPRNTGEPVWHRNAIVALSRLIDREKLDSVIIVAHSFGGDMAVKLAAEHPDVVRAIVFLDSWPFSDRSWFHESASERIAQADSTVTRQSARFADLDEWQRFNTPGLADPERRLLYHGWFMATPVDVVIQYWRENSISDLNALWKRIDVPVLDIKAIPSTTVDPDKARRDRLDQLRANGLTSNVRTVFIDGASHFVHESRPAMVDSLIADFASSLDRRQ